MPRVKKDVLKPGRYRLADGRLIEYTQGDVKRLGQRLKQMKAAGLHVPMAWEHQDDAKPRSRAERMADRARFNLGFAEDAVMEGGRLICEIDVPDEEDARRLASARYVSPEVVTDWIDGLDRRWPGRSITHIAVTTHPVNPDQKPFERLSRGVERFSIADLVEPDQEAHYMIKQDAVNQLVEALSTAGIYLPEDFSFNDPEAAIRLITTAALNSKRSRDYEEQGGMDEVQESAPPVMMSHNAPRYNAADLKIRMEARRDAKLIGRR